MRKQQSGFTLIELVAVIVLLGILAVTALPRFVGLQNNARQATVDGIVGGMQGAMAQVYAGALIAGVDQTVASGGPPPTTPTVTTSGGAVVVSYGYPVALTANMQNAVDIQGNSLLIEENTVGSNRVWRVGFDINNNGSFAAADDCYAEYTEASSATSGATAIAVGTC